MDDWSVKTIVLGYDGTDGARRAAVVAASLAEALGAHIIVATAFPPYPRISEPTEKHAIEIAEARRTAEEMVQELNARGLIAEADELEGPAGETIVTCARTRRSELIVLGSRGLGELASLVLGSTSEYVAHHADVPVLIAR
ncbi:MAG: universal stress protein [Gaiellales bacterium]|nr:universal stress protein [Gaiellales bacterium]